MQLTVNSGLNKFSSHLYQALKILLKGTQYPARKRLPSSGLGLEVFIDVSTYLYTYRRQKFQNILERKLCNCFGQLICIYLKDI